MAVDGRVGDVIETERANAVVAWVLTAFLAGVALASLVDGAVLYGAFAIAVLGLVLLPPVAHRRWTAMLPWEVLLLAALPVVGRVFTTLPVTNRFATYLSVAAVALIVAVELHAFTPVRMTPGFAVLFVAVATLATAGVWAVVRWASDVWLGTAFLLDPAISPVVAERRLMWEFVFSTLAGVAAGAVFELYFRRRGRGRPTGEGADP